MNHIEPTFLYEHCDPKSRAGLTETGWEGYMYYQVRLAVVSGTGGSTIRYMGSRCIYEWHLMEGNCTSVYTFSILVYTDWILINQTYYDYSLCKNFFFSRVEPWLSPDVNEFLAFIDRTGGMCVFIIGFDLFCSNDPIHLILFVSLFGAQLTRLPIVDRLGSG